MRGFRQAVDAHRSPDSHLLVEDQPGQLAHPVQLAGTARQHDPPPGDLVNAARFQPVAHQLEGLLDARRNDADEEGFRHMVHMAVFLFADRRNGDRLALVESRGDGAAEQRLHPLGVRERGREPTGDVVGHMATTDRHRIGENQIAFELNRTLLVSKLIEGNYANYRQVIPSEAKERITLERQTFLTAVRRVSLLASEKSNSVKLIFSKSNIDIVANTPEVGEAKESLPVMYKGREFSIAFNPEFLMAPLRNLSEDEIYLDLIDEMSPGVIKIAAPFLYVLMPMRFS